eukprot:gb/GECG01009691.1/.p1 GENE.gb/GECG01009691.1/~~gb/GECG01009691.1/.p1  ORF type:complete len:1013 (+),score=194.59 gb/GECG01009691.1/:1-3039(+)
MSDTGSTPRNEEEGEATPSRGHTADNQDSQGDKSHTRGRSNSGGSSSSSRTRSGSGSDSGSSASPRARKRQRRVDDDKGQEASSASPSKPNKEDEQDSRKESSRKRRSESSHSDSSTGSEDEQETGEEGEEPERRSASSREKRKEKKHSRKESSTRKRRSKSSESSTHSERSDERKRKHKERREKKGRSRGDKERGDGNDGKTHDTEISGKDVAKGNSGKAGEIMPSSDGISASINEDVAPGRTGGVYVPPHKMARLRKQVQDKSSEQYQRLAWDDLRKGINGVINKVNITNITQIIPELFSHNLVRGRGLLARAIMKAQMASPGFTHIYAALVSVVNTKMPENGELILKRVVLQFRRSFRRNDKVVAVSLAKFIAHLLNQQVAHEILALQLLTLLLERPTDSSVEVAVDFVKQCGQLLMELTPQGLHAIFERFRSILHEGQIDKRVQFMIEALFAVRKSGFADYPRVLPELDLVEADDQITHEIGLDDKLDKEETLDVFKYDPQFEENEKLWTEIKKEILGEESEEEEEGDEEEPSESEEEPEHPSTVPKTQVIEDKTETDVVSLRRTIYLTIMSSLSHDECAHKLLKLDIPEHLEHEVVNMLIECCAQEKTYLKYFGLLGQRFCLVKRSYQEAFETAFAKRYSTIHRLDTNKLRNVAKFFAHILGCDALPWTVFEFIRLNEDETTSSSRIFLKILIQELMQTLGMKKLLERFQDPHMQDIFAGLFPKDSPRNARFAINYFTSIGLGALTDDLRRWLREAPKQMVQQQHEEEENNEETGNDESSGSSSSGSGSDSGSSSDSGSDSDESGGSRSRGSSKEKSERRSANKRERSRSASEERSGRSKKRRQDSSEEDEEREDEGTNNRESSGGQNGEEARSGRSDRDNERSGHSRSKDDGRHGHRHSNDRKQEDYDTDEGDRNSQRGSKNGRRDKHDDERETGRRTRSHSRSKRSNHGTKEDEGRHRSRRSSRHSNGGEDSHRRDKRRSGSRERGYHGDKRSERRSRREDGERG